MIDDTISNRNDAKLNFKFNFEGLKENLEVIVIDSNNVKHELKTMDKCRDSALVQTERSFTFDEQEVVCKFDKPKKGKWTFNIINPISQTYSFKLKIFVFYQANEDAQTYYPNYYNNNNREFKKHRRRKKKDIDLLETELDLIKVDAKWSNQVLEYPQSQVIFAAVSKDLKPIINASVKALIYRPSGDQITLELHDNGLNADRSANDGIYSRYFSNFNLNGHYFGRVKRVLRIFEFEKLIKFLIILVKD